MLSTPIDGWSPEERKCLLREMESFLCMSAEEQQSQRCTELSTLEEFQRRRMGTSAVGACLALTEWVHGVLAEKCSDYRQVLL